MASAKYGLTFTGYFFSTDRFANRSGIYCVYACKPAANGEVSLKRLIYIGESENVKDRLANHDRKFDWVGKLEYGEKLCYSAAGVDTANRVRCEAAMINHHKPPLNTEYMHSFPFDFTEMYLEGDIALLSKSFTVLRS